MTRTGFVHPSEYPNKESELIRERKLNEGQIQRLFDYNRMTVYEKNRKLNIKQNPIEIV